MIDEKKMPGEASAEVVDPPKKRTGVNSLTIFLVLVFLLILLAESVAASSLTGGTNGAVAINYTKEFNTCIALGKSEEKCNKTATAWGAKSPTPKDCDPYKAGRAVEAGETFDQYISYYNMTNTQRDEFIKINNLSPAYPKTIIYTGVRYCLPYGVNKKAAEEANEVTGYNPKADFGWQVTGINGWEITFELFNFEKYDKVNVYFWRKQPSASFWRCRTASDESCTDIMYRDKEVFSDGYSETRKIWLGQFKVSKKTLTLTFPQEVTGWNQVYVCMHSLFRDEADTSNDPTEYYASYHNYCQLINLDRKVTTRIIREPAPTQTWLTYTPTPANTPCGYNYYPLCRPPLGGFWGMVCGAPESGYVCLQPCPGTRLPIPTNTPCATQYGPSCPGTRIPLPTVDPACPGVCQLNYHIDPIFTPTYDPVVAGLTPQCDMWWMTPSGSR